jgi:transcription termination factor Rho
MSEKITGVYKGQKKGGGLLLDPVRSFRLAYPCAVVPKKLAADYSLNDGATICGDVATEKGGQILQTVDTICGLAPAAFAARKKFADLIAISPYERFRFCDSGDTDLRIVDLVAPIGKGTRGLIVSPPKAGKTVLLEKLAKAVRKLNPETRLLILLIDERPEEVTNFRRSVDAEVLASSSDQTVEEHVQLAEVTLAHIRAELECGHDVMVLVDSLTRMGRAFNLGGSSNGPTMSGGVGVGALEIPRRFFGLARKIENGGSVTIIATALVDTGSRMDQLIFEEFKGTGNSEIILNRSLAESRIFPAIDLPQSGTRKEDRLYDEQDMIRLSKLRRILAERKPAEAMQSLLQLMEKHPTNEAFLASIPV